MIIRVMGDKKSIGTQKAVKREIAQIWSQRPA